MTFVPAVINIISTLNSTNILLASNGEFLGSSENVVQYSSISVTLNSDVKSAAIGLKLEFSSDNINWDIINGFTYTAKKSYDKYAVNVKGAYFRLRYTNGTIGQTSFMIQTKFETSKSTENNIMPIDAFGRLRVSNPYTLITNNQITGKQLYKIYENITGSATSVHNTSASCVVMSTTGTGSVIRRNRVRAIYQPGNSLLVYMTGVLNNGSNASTVTTKIGYYDNNDGYFFQYNNGILSIVERSSVSGSVVNTIVNQSVWNYNTMDGTLNENYTIDTTKALIYWFNLEWLGVGFVDCGVIISGNLIKCHRFEHSNLLPTPYIKTASLPPTYEIISTGGTGSMTSICQTAISEGGYSPQGSIFSANVGSSAKSVGSREPIISLRLKSGSIINAFINNISVVSTSGANALIEIYRFVDTDASSILNNTTFISANNDSSVEYNIAASTVNITNGLLVNSTYFANNTDSVRFEKRENEILTSSASVSDLIVVCATSLGGNENYVASITWKETI